MIHFYKREGVLDQEQCLYLGRRPPGVGQLVLRPATRATAGCPNLQDLKANHPPPMGLFGRRWEPSGARRKPQKCKESRLRGSTPSTLPACRSRRRFLQRSTCSRRTTSCTLRGSSSKTSRRISTTARSCKSCSKS